MKRRAQHVNEVENKEGERDVSVSIKNLIGDEGMPAGREGGGAARREEGRTEPPTKNANQKREDESES